MEGGQRLCADPLLYKRKQENTNVAVMVKGSYIFMAGEIQLCSTQYFVAVTSAVCDLGDSCTK